MRFPGLKAARERREANPFCMKCGTVISGVDERCSVCGIGLGQRSATMDKTRVEIEASDTMKELMHDVDDSEGDNQAAVIQEECPQCKSVGLSFRTAQLRSADEGQTIFYTCLSCKYVNISLTIPEMCSAMDRIH
mmetsp:Transcript_11139/g.46498  ORF Transcript_11139/g.46498 Transcript_11139/m.46498 type:complete len:135 (+) Transcript_11139:190-594(+)